MSASFRDPESREWKLRLTVGVVRDVVRETGVNLTLANSQSDWERLLFGDAEKLVGVLWVLCESQAKESSVTPEAFGHLFDGPTLEAAGEALANAIADFFPRSRIGGAIRAGLKKTLEATDRRAVEAVERAVAMSLADPSTDSNSATSAPESSAATPPG